jgi:hypothetical protein
MDRGIIDGTLHLVARSVFTLGSYFKRFEDTVIKGGVDWVKDRVLDISRASRGLQTGKIQEYAWLSMILAGALAVFIMILS